VPVPVTQVGKIVAYLCIIAHQGGIGGRVNCAQPAALPMERQLRHLHPPLLESPDEVAITGDRFGKHGPRREVVPSLVGIGAGDRGLLQPGGKAPGLLIGAYPLPELLRAAHALTAPVQHLDGIDIGRHVVFYGVYVGGCNKLIGVGPHNRHVGPGKQVHGEVVPVPRKSSRFSPKSRKSPYSGVISSAGR